MAERWSGSAAFVTPPAYFFGGHRFEPSSGLLTRGDIEVRLRPKTAAVLAVLLGRAGEVVTKSALVDEVWEIVKLLAAGRGPADLLFPSSSGGFRDGGNWKRDVRWAEYGLGHRVHDLRHTAATLWLGKGLDLKTVQAWLGHASAKLTADTYAHYLGSDADSAAIQRLNSALDSPSESFRGAARGTRLEP